MTKKIVITTILLIALLVIVSNVILKNVRKNIKHELYINQVGIKEIITDSNYYGFNEDVTVTFKLDKNPKYSIDSINVNEVIYKSSDFITNTDNEISISINTGTIEGHKTYYVESLDYSYLGISERSDFDYVFDLQSFSIYVGDNNSIHYIYDVEDLESLNINGTNKLMVDIDLSGVDFDQIEKFSGYLDGNGYKISNFTLSDENCSDPKKRCGFIGHNNGYINNIHLDNVNINISKYYVGGLTSSNSGTIENSSVTGVLNGYNHVGGMVGDNRGIIIDSFAEVNVNGNENVGGLVGINSFLGQIYNSYVEGSISGDTSVGGIVGRNEQNIKNSYAKVNVSGVDNVGGISGITYFGNIHKSYIIGEVTGTEDIGGLVGRNYRSDIVNSYAAVMVKGSENIGGLVGTNNGTLKNSFTVGYVDGINNTGGLVGYGGGDVENSYRYIDQVIKINNEISILYDYDYAVSKEDLLNKEWFIKVLKFDDDIWDLSKIGEGYLPKLKSLSDQEDYKFVE